MTARIEVIGAKKVLQDLKQIDPEARKQFAKDAKTIAQPIITEAQSKYPQQALSGMRYRWLSRGRQILPWDARKARRGITVKVDAGKRANGVITIIQKDFAAAIIEFAGNDNRLGRSLSTLAWGEPARVMWPATDGRIEDVTDEMRKALDAVAETINRRIVS